VQSRIAERTVLAHCLPASGVALLAGRRIAVSLCGAARPAVVLLDRLAQQQADAAVGSGIHQSFTALLAI